MAMQVTGSMTIGATEIPLDVNTSAHVEMKVVSVDADGIATIEESFTGGEMTVSGQAVPVGDMPLVTFRMTQDGRVISADGSTIFSAGTGGPSQVSADHLSAILPDGPVEPGDTWSKRVEVVVYGNDMSYTAHGSYLRNEIFGAVEAAVVKTTTDFSFEMTVGVEEIAELMGIPADQLSANTTFVYTGEVSSEVTSWIDIADQKLLKTTSTGPMSMEISAEGLTADQFPPGGITMQATATVSMTYE